MLVILFLLALLYFCYLIHTAPVMPDDYDNPDEYPNKSKSKQNETA